MNNKKLILGLLTPLIAALAAWLTAAVAKYGVHLDQSGVNAALVTGASAGIAVMLKLIHDVETDVDKDLKKKVPPTDDELMNSLLNAIEPQLRQAAIAAVQTEVLNLTHTIQVTPPLGPGGAAPAQVTAGITAGQPAQVTAGTPAEAAPPPAGVTAPEPPEPLEPLEPPEATVGTPEPEPGRALESEPPPEPQPEPEPASASSAEPAEPLEAPAASAERQAEANGWSMADTASPAARRPGVPPQG